MKNQNLALKIRNLRNKKGLTQEQLSDESKLSLRTIQRIEKGESMPRGDTLIKLSQTLEITPDELLDWTKIEDKGFLTLFNLSALSFVLHPFLGIIIPLVLWIYKKEKLYYVDILGRKIISFQISWTLLAYLTLIGISKLEFEHFFIVFNFNLFDFISSIFNNFSFLSLLMITLYLYNILLVLINTKRIQKDLSFWYLPAIPFLK